jgi:hypothetical protein
MRPALIFAGLLWLYYGDIIINFKGNVRDVREPVLYLFSELSKSVCIFLCSCARPALKVYAVFDEIMAP